MDLIIEFCLNCGIIIPEGIDDPEYRGTIAAHPACENCGADISVPGDRIQGKFHEVEAKLLRIAVSS